MPVTEVVRSWADQDFRARLATDQLAGLPEHPAGSIDAELDQLVGTFDPASREECPVTTFSRTPCCF